MRILITGGAGFIGSAVIRKAIHDGHTVCNIDALTYASSLDSLVSVAESNNYYFEYIDLRERKKIDQVLEKFQPDSIIHLAAESHVDRSIDDASGFITTNINGTYNLLESSRIYWDYCGKPRGFRFIHVSTDEVFGSLECESEIQFKEDSNYDPNSPYASSKAAADHLVQAWNKTYGLPVIITHSSNNYGPYQFPEKLIPVVIINALDNISIPIYGDGKNIRDWIHVDDHAEALLLLLEKGKNGDNYNIGGRTEITNLAITNQICDIVDCIKKVQKGSSAKLITFVEDRPAHDRRYAINTDKLYRHLNWSPKISFERGLEETVHWYFENQDWWRPLLSRSGIRDRLGKL